MMCAYLLKDHEHQGKVASWLDARFQALHQRYERWLAHCLDNRGAVMLFGGMVLLSLPVFYQLAQRELAPEEDSGGIFAMAEPPDYGSLEYTTISSTRWWMRGRPCPRSITRGR
jgi:multidrug efflux pump